VIEPGAVSRTVGDLRTTLTAFDEFLSESQWTRRAGDSRMCDFVVGNPHDPPLPALVDALSSAAIPRRSNWYAYTMNAPEATETVAASLRERFGLPFDSRDVFMTNGNFAGIAVALRTIVDPGDEVVFVSPPWFFYEALIEAAGATPVRVLADRRTFDLDIDAIERAITRRTRALLVNSPHNPSGRIYPPEQLDALAEVLAAGERRAGRPVYLLSDEAYNRIVYDDAIFPTPVAHYERSFLLYTYAKTLLAPGSRLGYIALPRAMPDREALRDAIGTVQMLTGWAFPVAVLQHALPELEPLSIDVKQLQRRRDRLCSALAELGYDLIVPQGTFYILARSPLDDDVAFVALLNAHDVFVLPGSVFEMPGWFRISVTATDDMVERGIAGFEAAAREAGTTPRPARERRRGLTRESK
jgi:aspartate aminotransferase